MQIVDSDAFQDMPMTSQLLYFHLVMKADDEGFIGNPKKICRGIGASDDDLKILIAKRFLLAFESGVVVIKHWLIHNTIRMDRFNPTGYQEEKNNLYIKDNKSYTDVATNGKPIGNQMAGQVKLSKVKIIKTNTVKKNRKRTEDVPLVKKDSSSIEEPFVWKDYIKKLEDDKRRGLQVIGFYLKEKKINCDTRGEAQATVRRYLKVASQIQHFSDDKIVEATEKVKKDYPDMWTLETIYKQLTK